MDHIQMTLVDTVPGIGNAGDRVELALQPADVREATEIPTYLAGYSPFGMRADEASPVLLVDNDEDKYRSFNSDDAFRRVDVKGSIQGAVPEVDPKSSLDSYKVVDRYIGAFVPRVTQLQDRNNPNYDPVMAASRRCRRALDLDREIDVWTLLGTTTSWNALVRTAVAGGNEWTDPLNSDPILDIQTAIQKSFQPITGMWMNQNVAHVLLRHPAVRDHMRMMIGDTAAPPSMQRVAEAGAPGASSVDFVIPGLPPVHVVSSKVKNESSSALDYILSSEVVVLLSSPVGMPTDGETINSSKTFRRKGPSGTGFEAREYEVPGRGPLGGTMLVVSMADIAKMTSTFAGGIISNVT